MDESALTGESDAMKKEKFDKCLELKNKGEKKLPSPLILSGTNCIEGSGKGIVIAVGEHSQKGIIRRTVDNAQEDDKTPLEYKLEKIDDIIEQLSTENKFLVEIDDKKEKEIIDKRTNLQKKENIGFSEFMLKSSLMENKILSGLNYSINDYNKFSSNISNKYNNIFNEDISKSILKQEKTNQNNNIININSSKYNIISMDNENSDSDMENNIISTKIKKNSKY